MGKDIGDNDVLWGGPYVRGRIMMIHDPGDADGLLIAWVNTHLKGCERGVSRRGEIYVDPDGIYFVVPPQPRQMR